EPVQGMPDLVHALPLSVSGLGRVPQIPSLLRVRRTGTSRRCRRRQWLRYGLLLRLAIHPTGGRSRRRRSTGRALSSRTSWQAGERGWWYEPRHDGDRVWDTNVGDWSWGWPGPSLVVDHTTR